MKSEEKQPQKIAGAVIINDALPEEKACGLRARIENFTLNI